jgi:hypothetical protein
LHITEVNSEICCWIEESKLEGQVFFLGLRIWRVAHGIEADWPNLQIATHLAIRDRHIELRNARMNVVGTAVRLQLVVGKSDGAARNNGEINDFHGFGSLAFE